MPYHKFLCYIGVTPEKQYELFGRFGFLNVNETPIHHSHCCRYQQLCSPRIPQTLVSFSKETKGTSYYLQVLCFHLTFTIDLQDFSTAHASGHQVPTTLSENSGIENQSSWWVVDITDASPLCIKMLPLRSDSGWLASLDNLPTTKASTCLSSFPGPVIQLIGIWMQLQKSRDKSVVANNQRWRGHC
jgi:hypothetical protein